MTRAAKRLFICLDNTGYEDSLERLKIYVALPDAKAERTGYLRITDESGEDYLYPSQRLDFNNLLITFCLYVGSNPTLSAT
jgi:hypothetical protein